MTGDRNTPHRDEKLGPQPMAAATVIYGGHMVAVNATGYAVPASAGAAVSTQTVLGVSDGWADNTGALMAMHWSLFAVVGASFLPTVPLIR